MADAGAALLDEQKDYYRARAGEYDDWWKRIGRYDRGEEATRRWWADVAEVGVALADANLSGDVLELACGTGWWTERLARTARHLTCIDASLETIAINRTRLGAAGLSLPTYRVADLFAWQPDATFDTVFFSFWLSHVPDGLFDRFWSAVATSLKPGGRVFFIDSAPDKTSTARDHQMPNADGVQERRLNDGRSFRVVKLFYDPADLARRLDSLGWRSDVRGTANYFIYGQARRD
jgi:demethylmenaquinone methyltransferase/2-methoxy-6-polyprenyl-1,4-benzoquinol methylase